jgi:hypothetical protein
MAHPHTTVREDRSRPTIHRSGTNRSDPTQPDATSPHRANHAVVARWLSIASAALILTGGYVHLCLYRNGYRFIPKIGVSFLIQAGSSAVLAAALLVRGGHLRIGRHTLAVAQLTRVAAIGLSLGTLAALGIAHTPGGLFQFREIGLRPAPQTLIAIVAEAVAAILLTIATLEGLATSRIRATVAAATSPAGRTTREAA